jgi:hypothetical protein
MTNVQLHNFRLTIRRVRGLGKVERAKFYMQARLGVFGAVLAAYFP